MPQAEATLRRAGALAAASLLVLFPATVQCGNALALVLPLFFVFLVGCAAVLLSPAHRVVAGHARRAAEAVREILVAPARAATELRWVCLTCVMLYVARYVRKAAVAGEEAASANTVSVLLQFLGFLVSVWTVFLSMLMETGSPPERRA